MDDRIARHDQGFSLIELVVTVAVISVLAVGVTLVATRDKPVETDAEQFAGRYMMLRQLAVQGQERLGLAITPRSSQIFRRKGEDWQAEGREALWRERAVFRSLRPNAPANEPEIVFLSNGQTSPFEITFGRAPAITCASDGWTGVSCRKR